MSAVRDRRLLYAAVFLRATTTSTVGVTLGPYLARIGLDGTELGIVIAAGLSGAAIAALLATLFADRFGRRRFLLVLAACGVIGTLVFAVASSALALAAAAFVGTVNGMGRDRGAALILEQAALPSTASAERRTQVIAVYTMLQDIGHAIGALLAGVPVLLGDAFGLVDPANADTWPAPHRAVIGACAVVGLVAILIYAALGSAIEHGKAIRLSLSPHSRKIVTKISALFALDGFGGGFLTTALLSYFFFEQFGVREDQMALLFAGARVLNALSHLGAAWLARRIGLVNTMVFTHIPSSLLLVTVAFAPSFPIAAALFLAREGLVEMDVPTRSSYVLAVVAPEERTLASGITNIVRLFMWALAPLVASALMAGDELYPPLVVGAAMKITYDILLWRAFRSVRPPEEQR